MGKMFRPSNELKLANPHAAVHSPAAVSFLLISLSIFFLVGFPLLCAIRGQQRPRTGILPVPFRERSGGGHSLLM